VSGSGNAADATPALTIKASDFGKAAAAWCCIRTQIGMWHMGVGWPLVIRSRTMTPIPKLASICCGV
jgi:hypothetical protein